MIEKEWNLMRTSADKWKITDYHPPTSLAMFLVFFCSLDQSFSDRRTTHSCAICWLRSGRIKQGELVFSFITFLAAHHGAHKRDWSVCTCRWWVLLNVIACTVLIYASNEKDYIEKLRFTIRTHFGVTVCKIATSEELSEWQDSIHQCTLSETEKLYELSAQIARIFTCQRPVSPMMGGSEFTYSSYTESTDSSYSESTDSSHSATAESSRSESSDDSDDSDSSIWVLSPINDSPI